MTVKNTCLYFGPAKEKEQERGWAGRRQVGRNPSLSNSTASRNRLPTLLLPPRELLRQQLP